MPTNTQVARIAALIGDPARTAMLMALMDGRALTAGELAGAAGVTPQTASSHLAQLSESGLLAVERQGRHRYHRLASAPVASMIEGIMAVAAPRPSAGEGNIRTGPRDARLRRARSCYDHLAGSVAVAIAERLWGSHWSNSGTLSSAGFAALKAMGVDVAAAQRRATPARLFCRPCVDWSERRPHVAGTIGAALLETCLAQGWMRRTTGSRAIDITPAGVRALHTHLGISAAGC